MQLAADPIVIEIAGEAFELRPTLRAAMRLTRKHGDFAALYSGILADHVTVSGDVVREATGSHHAAEMFAAMLDAPGAGIRALIEPLKLPLLRYVVQLSGIDPDDDRPDDNVTAGEAMPFADYYAELFRIGTGWLGWSPEDTWEAAPAEILAAQKGRSDLVTSILRSIFGDATGEPADPNAEPVFDRAGYAELRAMFAKAA